MIQTYFGEGITHNQLAKKLERSPSTTIREAHHNQSSGKYGLPCQQRRDWSHERSSPTTVQLTKEMTVMFENSHTQMERVLSVSADTVIFVYCWKFFDFITCYTQTNYPSDETQNRFSKWDFSNSFS